MATEAAEDLVSAIAERKLIASTMPEWLLKHVIQNEWDGEPIEHARIDSMKSVSACYKQHMRNAYEEKTRMRNWIDRPANRLAKDLVSKKFKNAGVSNRHDY